MRTRGKGEGLLEQKENMRFGWAFAQHSLLAVSSLKPLDFSLFTFHSSLNISFACSSPQNAQITL